MTFLELCQKAGTDSGLISYQNVPTTVVGATGRWASIVSFVAQAWNDIQRSRGDWEFMRANISHALVVGQRAYVPSDLGIPNSFSRFAGDAAGYQPWHLYDPAIGVADDQNLTQIPTDEHEMTYGRGAQTLSRPTKYAIANGQLYVGPLPDKAYTLVGLFWQAPHPLIDDADEPVLPEHFHDLIVWKAIMKISGKDGAFADRLVAQGEYSTMFRQLVSEQTRPIELGDSLA
jgi:hypothetical protein